MQLEAWTDRAGAEALRAPPPTPASSACPNGRSRSPRRRLPNTQRPQLAGQPTTYASDSATATHAKQTVYATCIRHLLTDFLAAIDEARPPRVDLDAATAAVAVAAAATEAARTGRTLQLTRSEH